MAKKKNEKKIGGQKLIQPKIAKPSKIHQKGMRAKKDECHLLYDINVPYTVNPCQGIHLHIIF